MRKLVDDAQLSPISASGLNLSAFPTGVSHVLVSQVPVDELHSKHGT
jgi:hypothetical protein